ncbi:MAG: heme ABC transporter ATP-binding protein [Pseudomonadota bacterium]
MIDTTGLTVIKSGRVLLQDVSFFLMPGEVLIVVGPNGAGKTTLLSSLAGDIVPTKGVVRMDNVHVTEMPSVELAQKRAVLLQDSNVNFPFTGREIVEMGRSPHASISGRTQDKEITNAVAEMLQIQDLLARNIMTLSGGERQRVQFARVLAQIWQIEPRQSRYLLLDEPTSALDIAYQHHVLNIGRYMARDQNVGVLAIVHDLNLASLYADKIAMLCDGQLVTLGTPAEVLTSQRIGDVYQIDAQVIQHPTQDLPLVVASRS